MSRSLGSHLSGAILVSTGAVLLLFACSATPKSKEDKLCTPGAYVFCRCSDRQEGTKLCREDAQSFGPCEPCESSDDPELPLDPGEPRRPPTPDAGHERKDDAGADSGGRCGDAIVQDGEDCDDKNDDELDGCDESCKLAGTAPKASNGCPGLPVHVWGGAHKPTLIATTVGSGNRQTKSVCPSNAGNTPTSGAAGPDRVFEVFAHKSGMMTVLVSDTNYNAHLYASDACPTDNVVWFACSNKVDGIGGETLTFPVDTGKSYFVFVDGALPSSLDQSLLQGNFRITFSIR